jgi:hypothetical protein
MTNLAVPLPIEARYTRSVHLQRDFSDIDVALIGYQVTPLVLQTIERVAAGLNPTSKDRAFSVIGPYGSGKSAFGLFLSHFLSSTSTDRQDLIVTHRTASFADRPIYNVPTLLPVLVSGNNSALRGAILRALRSTLEQRVDLTIRSQEFLDVLDAAVENVDEADPETITRLVEQATQHVAAESHFSGLVLVIDELGQYLNYTARQGDERDLFILQTLAEMASRSGENPCIILTILHQAFEQYARTAGVVQRTEWAKVQGRYIDLPFQEPQSQIIRMVGRALRPQANDPYIEERRQWAVQLAPLTEQLSLRPGDVSYVDWQQLLEDTYPVHPTVLLALPLLFRHLAQNERSLFAFLSSQEPWSLQDVLLMSGGHRESIPIYRLPQLYAYVESSLGPSLFSQARGRRWAELAEALIRTGDLERITIEVLTTIGTLGALGQSQALRAGASHVSFALRDELDAADIEGAIQQLQARKHIIYRHHRDSYLLWEGSDLDLEGLVQVAARSLGNRTTPTVLLQQHAQITPFVARRHSYVTGAVRQFDVQFVAADELSTIAHLSPRVDGEVLYVVPTDDASLDVAQQWVAEVERQSETRRVIVLPRQVQRLRELLLEVSALEHVMATEPQLENDAVARRELASRLVEAQQALADLIALTYGPGHSQWWWCGQPIPMETMADLDQLLSHACDVTYYATPQIWNELIVRRQLSSMSTKARRNLVEAMLDHGHVETLGIIGYPPERAMYESVLRSSGMHRRDADGHWRFGPPPEDNPKRLRPVWDAILQVFDSSTHSLRPLTDIYTLLEAPPFGVKAGLLPVLFMACYLANAGEVALYEHGNYVPIADIAVFERLLRQPGYFSIRTSRVRGVRVAVYERLARVLAPNALNNTGQPAILDAVAPLLRFAKALPEYSKYTKHVSKQAQSIRQALLETQAPDELLFEVLPPVCGVPPFVADLPPDEQHIEMFFATLRSGLTELQDAYTKLIQLVREHIRTAFGATANETNTLRDELTIRYQQISAATSDSQLRAFGVRIENANDGDGWIESIAALIMRKPLSNWRDHDIDEFGLQMADLGRRFRAMEQLAVAVQAVPPTATLLRIGLTDASGERSVVVHTQQRDPVSQRLHNDLTAILDQHATVSTEQQLIVLAELLSQLMDQAQPRSEP